VADFTTDSYTKVVEKRRQEDRGRKIPKTADDGIMSLADKSKRAAAMSVRQLFITSRSGSDCTQSEPA
jgi:hypothetical protein